MPVVCVDASLVLMLLLPDEHRDWVDSLWHHWARENVTPFSAPLLYAEVTSVLREAVFFGRLESEEGDQAFDTFCELSIPTSTRTDLHRLAWGLAKEHHQPRAYDATYLAVARAEGCDLWTGDRRLVNSVALPWVKWAGDHEA